MKLVRSGGVRPNRGALILAIALAGCTTLAVAAVERTEKREPCAQYTATKRPLFGDLHVHTSYSFDSFVSSQRNDPNAAYRYARGEAITLPDADAN